MKADRIPGLGLASLSLLAAAAPLARGSTHLNPSDRSPSVVLSPDLLGVTYTNGASYHGVRSDRAILPGSGFFYFEGHREVGVAEYGFGLATAASTLDERGGADAESFGVDVTGGIWYGGVFHGGFPAAANATYGIAVDYRGAHPTAYVIVRETAGGPEIVFRKVHLDAISAPLHIFVYGLPATTGVQQTINPGNDLAAAPFRLDPSAALDAYAYRASEGLVRNWNAPPVLETTIDRTMAVIGSPVTAHGKATAPDGTDLTGSIHWTESRGSQEQTGRKFSFVPDLLGDYVLTARVAGLEGATVTSSVRVRMIRNAGIDCDDDDLSYAVEIAAGTDPFDHDSDDDGLLDGEELQATSTDPLDPDTDGDRMSDGWEVRHGLDPHANDANGDPDQDTFRNRQEFDADTDPQSNQSYPGRGTVLLSLSDRSPSVQLSADRLGAIFTAPGTHGVRTDVAVQPGSGWYSFEGHREVAPGNFGFGVASPAASLDAAGGSDDQSFGVLATGALRYAGQTVATFADPGAVSEYGLVIDYSGANPRVHLIVDRLGDSPQVFAPIVLQGITTPVHVFVFGEPVAAGVQQTINAGADPRNRPFHYPAAYLSYLAGYPGAEFLGSGFGPEHAYAGPPRIDRQDPVVLVHDAATNAEIVLAPDGLGASYGAYQKSAVRANQTMIGEFRYFEAHREVGPVNIGQGLINPCADIDPYCCVSTNPSNAPPSMSMNSGGGVWQNLVFVTNFQRDYTTYGFAVDYRGSRPLVHCIVGDALITTLTLSDFITPIQPMLYGDPAGPVLVNTINFGTKPFEYDAAVILSNAGIDTTALVTGWGDANRPALDPNVLSRVTITSAPSLGSVGQPILATAAATDVDRIHADSFIEWSVDTEPATGRGGSFVFTPRRAGPHQLRAKFTDSLGSTATAVRDIAVDPPADAPH